MQKLTLGLAGSPGSFVPPGLRRNTDSVESRILNSSPSFASIPLCNPRVHQFLSVYIVSPYRNEAIGWLSPSLSQDFECSPSLESPPDTFTWSYDLWIGGRPGCSCIESGWQLSQTSLAQPSFPRGFRWLQRRFLPSGAVTNDRVPYILCHGVQATDFPSSTWSGSPKAKEGQAWKGWSLLHFLRPLFLPYLNCISHQSL